MRNKAKASATAAMVRLLSNTRYEVLPTASIEDTVLEHVGRSEAVTVTASPGKGLEATLDLTERLTKHGYTAVPHLAARMVRDRSELEEICARLTSQGIDTIFVPGGDADPPGAYPEVTIMPSPAITSVPAPIGIVIAGWISGLPALPIFQMWPSFNPMSALTMPQ